LVATGRKRVADARAGTGSIGLVAP